MNNLTFLNDKKLNGELYAILQSVSNYRIINKGQNTFETFINKKNMPTQTEMCRRLGIKSPKTLRKQFEYMKEQSYIIPGEGDIVYYLPEMEDIYSLLPTETINYLVDSCKPHVIKLYIYLGQRYMLGLKLNKNYEFTLQQIADHLGLSMQNHSRSYEVINNALWLLQNSGLIDYYEYTFEGYIVKKVLTSFSSKVKRIHNDG